MNVFKQGSDDKKFVSKVDVQVVQMQLEWSKSRGCSTNKRLDVIT